MILFENLIFLVVYLIQLIIPDVSSETQEDIDRQRFNNNHHRTPVENLSDVKKILQEKLSILQK